MRKPRKVVPITKAKRKPSAAIEVPVPVEGAIRILTCHRTPGQISFSLGPLLASAKLRNRQSRAKETSSSFPVARPTQRTTEVDHSSRHEGSSQNESDTAG